LFNYSYKTILNFIDIFKKKNNDDFDKCINNINKKIKFDYVYKSPENNYNQNTNVEIDNNQNTNVGIDNNQNRNQNDLYFDNVIPIICDGAYQNEDRRERSLVNDNILIINPKRKIKNKKLKINKKSFDPNLCNKFDVLTISNLIDR